MLMKRHFGVLAVMLVASTIGSTASATILFSDDFETDSSGGYNVNLSTGNHAATFAFDYSTVGIPPAPNSGGTTKGLKLEANYLNANNATETNGGVSVSPTGLSTTGDFNISMDVWLNSIGPFPAGGSGSTQLTTYGWGTAGTSAQWFNARDSIVFGTTGEAGSSQDYVIYANAALAANGSPLYAASGVTDPEGDDSRNHPHVYYAGFGNVAPPLAQTALYPTIQTGSVIVGATGFAWHEVLIQKRGSVVTWTMDGLLLGTVDAALVPALGGGNFFMGQSDINNTASTATDVRALLFGLFDNVVVEYVPEPGSISLVMVCMSALAFKRRSF
jgi:hypothetical protein